MSVGLDERLPHYDEDNVEAIPLMDSQTDEGVLMEKTISKSEERVGRIQFLALCFSLFMVGWNDGSIGPLLPRIMQVYNVSYGHLSYIFVVNCVGVVLGALANMPLSDKFGYGKIIVLGSLLQSITLLTQSFALSFPIFVACFFVAGIGIAIQDAQCNGYIALVKHEGEFKMGFLQAAYGLGALIAPLSATQFSQMTRWTSHYLVSFLFSALNMVLLAVIFRFREQDDCLRESGEVVPESAKTDNSSTKYAQMLRLRAVHLLALFLILYIGVEVTIGGWIVTYMIDVRGGKFSSGYVATGFFGGLTIGRIVLIRVNKKLGEVRAVYIYTAVVIVFQLVIWLIPSIITDSIAVCLIGVFLGPIYPIVMRHAAHIIPRSLVTGSIGWIAACGAAGSALLPFLTGSLAEKFGIASVQPFLLVMIIIMGVVWSMVPTGPGGDL